VGTRLGDLVDRLAGYERLVEVGVGRRADVAGALAAAGCTVTATDVVARAVPDGVRFVVDDVLDPDPAVYADAACVYALNVPPELHRPLVAVAKDAGAACAFTTLGGDQPTVPVERDPITDDVVYWVRR
jgi:hypothetical protein